MLEVKQINVICDFCQASESMRLNWSEFKLPSGWQFRTRSWNDDNRPEEIQIRCKACSGGV